MSSEQEPVSEARYWRVRVVLRSCILCGEPEWDHTGKVQRELTYLEALREAHARCSRCGGALVGEFTMRLRVKTEDIDFGFGRGRPTNAERARRAASLALREGRTA